MHCRLALFNLRAGGSEPAGTLLIQRMGLGDAVELLDSIEPVSDLDWIVSFHKAVGLKQISPRPLDNHSWAILRDEVIQSWFDRFVMLKRVLEDPIFSRWKDVIFS